MVFENTRYSKLLICNLEFIFYFIRKILIIFSIDLYLCTILEDKVREISFDGNLTMYLSLLSFLIVSNRGIACLKIHNLIRIRRWFGLWFGIRLWIGLRFRIRIWLWIWLRLRIRLWLWCRSCSKGQIFFFFIDNLMVFFLCLLVGIVREFSYYSHFLSYLFEFFRGFLGKFFKLMCKDLY